MLARLQRRITLALLASALGWWAAWWPARPLVAWGGVLALLGGHSMFLALEMLAMVATRGGDPAPRASARCIAAAWLRESLAALQVFCWRQPFRSAAVPDHLPDDAHGRSGVVLVHGFVCNRGFWTPWLRRLRARGQPFIAVNLEPVAADIEAYRPIVEAAVDRMAALTGRPPSLLCHSMGGLVARDWLRSGPHHGRVARVVTIATPHRGTWLARHARRGAGLQMRHGGAWLDALAASEPPALRRRFTCWYSNCDNVVFPASTATLPGADNRFLPGRGHVALAFDTDLMDAVLSDLHDGSPRP